MSSISPPDSPRRRVRGITKGKNTARIVKHTDKRIPVTVDEQFNAFVGISASKVATSLGIQLKKKAPVEGISKWSDIDGVIKDSIVQGVLNRSKVNKQNRGQVSYTHTMGSKSFASALCDISVKAKKDEVQPKFSEFFKLSHQRKKTEGWIDLRCEQEYAVLEQLENESVETGELISPEELSKSVFGKKSYFKGLGPSIKAKNFFNGVSNMHNNDELQSLNAEVEILRSSSQEYQEKFVSQETMITSQADMIESFKKEIEEIKKWQKRFLSFVIGGGFLDDMGSNHSNNLT